MRNLAALGSCSALEREHIEVGASSPAALQAFLAHVAAIARSHDDTPRVLDIVPLLAEADWLDGELRVELTGDDEVTTLALFLDHGFGVRERLADPMTMHVALDEFASAVHAEPSLISPLRVSFVNDKLILAMTDAWDDEQESIAIADSSLHETERKTVPPPPGSKPREGSPDKSGAHTHPTVRRMVAIRPEALRTWNDEAENDEAENDEARNDEA